MYSIGRWIVAVGLVCCLAGVGQAQPPSGRRGPGMMGGPGMLLQNKGVQEELKLSDEQITKVKDVLQDIRTKHKDEFEKLRDLDQAERREKGMELMKTVGEETSKALEGVLKPEQAKRLKQIRYQAEGARAFQDPEVEKALQLTDEQKESLKTIAEDARQEMEKLFQGGRGQGNFEEARKKGQEIRKDSMEKSLAVLKEEQKKEWKELTGEPFQVKFERPEGGPRPRGDRPASAQP